MQHTFTSSHRNSSVEKKIAKLATEARMDSQTGPSFGNSFDSMIELKIILGDAATPCKPHQGSPLCFEMRSGNALDIHLDDLATFRRLSKLEPSISQKIFQGITNRAPQSRHNEEQRMLGICYATLTLLDEVPIGRRTLRHEFFTSRVYREKLATYDSWLLGEDSLKKWSREQERDKRYEAKEREKARCASQVAVEARLKRVESIKKSYRGRRFFLEEWKKRRALEKEREDHREVEEEWKPESEDVPPNHDEFDALSAAKSLIDELDKLTGNLDAGGSAKRSAVEMSGSEKNAYFDFEEEVWAPEI